MLKFKEQKMVQKRKKKVLSKAKSKRRSKVLFIKDKLSSDNLFDSQVGKTDALFVDNPSMKKAEKYFFAERKIFSSKFFSLLAGFVLAGLFCAGVYVFATYGVDEYYPAGNTLNPTNCDPGDTYCKVQEPLIDFSTLAGADVTTALGFTPIQLSSLSSTATGLTYTNTTGVISLTSGYVIPTTTNQTNWNSAYSAMHTQGTDTTVSNTLSGVLFSTSGTLSTKAIGTDIQAYNANLASLAGLSYASSSFVKMTAANTFSLDTSSYMANPMDAIGQIIYGGASGTPTKLSAGSSGQILQSGGAGAPAWTTATYPATTTANQILFSTATNTVGGSSNFTFDTTNGLTITNTGSSQIISSNGNSLILGSSGGSNNETLTFDFQTTANQVALTSDTSVSLLDLGTIALSSGSYIAGTPLITSVVESGPPGTSPANGALIVDSGDSGRLYVRYGGAWHYISMTAGFQIPNFETTDPISGDKIEEGDIVLGMVDQTLSDDALHGIWVKWDSVKQELIDEIKEQGLNVEGTMQEGEVEGVESETMLERVTNVLESLGISIKDGITNITKLAVENSTTNVARINKMEMVDSATGDIYCTWIQNGEWVKVKGDCGSLVVAEVVGQPTPTEQMVEQAQNAIEQSQQTVEQVQQIADQVQQAVQVAQESAQQAQQAVQQVQEQLIPDVRSLEVIDDINVDYGTKINKVKLSETITVVLSDSSTQDLYVVWDSGTPDYDADVAGTYAFLGTLTLPDGVTNENNLQAAVNVIVAEESVHVKIGKGVQDTVSAAVETAQDAASAAGDVIQNASEAVQDAASAVGDAIENSSSALLNGIGNFANWISDSVNFSTITQNAGAGLLNTSEAVGSWLSAIFEAMSKFLKIFVFIK